MNGYDNRWVGYDFVRNIHPPIRCYQHSQCVHHDPLGQFVQLTSALYSSPCCHILHVGALLPVPWPPRLQLEVHTLLFAIVKLKVDTSVYLSDHIWPALPSAVLIFVPSPFSCTSWLAFRFALQGSAFSMAGNKLIMGRGVTTAPASR